MWKESEMGCAQQRWDQTPRMSQFPLEREQDMRLVGTSYSQEACAVFNEWAPNNLWKEFQFNEVC